MISFNEGELAKIKVLEQLGMSVGTNTKFILKGIDQLRITKSEIELNNMTQMRKQKCQKEVRDEG